MAEKKITREELSQMLSRGIFANWLGIALTGVDDDGITLAVKWREEFMVNAKLRYTHGGILATLIDIAGDYALAAKIGRPVPTVDLRIDYHRMAEPGDLTVKAGVVKLGRTISTAEAYVFDGEGNLLASGRGVYHSKTDG